MFKGSLEKLPQALLEFLLVARTNPPGDGNMNGHGSAIYQCASRAGTTCGTMADWGAWWTMV